MAAPLWLIPVIFIGFLCFGFVPMAFAAGGVTCADVATGPIAPTATGTVPISPCLMCSVFTGFEFLSKTFSATTFATLAPHAVVLMRLMMMLSLMLLLATVAISPDGGAQLGRGLVSQVLAFFAGLVLLSGALLPYPFALDSGYRACALHLAHPTTNYTIFGYVFDLMETQAIEFGKTVIYIGENIHDNRGFAGLPGILVKGTDATPYSTLWAYIEQTCFSIVILAWGQLSIFKPADTFAFLVLAAPYLLVMGIFAAYLVRTMFFFMVIAAISPLLIAGFPFKTLRQYTFAALKILVTASLTIIFASFAMAFTASILGHYLIQLFLVISPSDLSLWMNGSPEAHRILEAMQAEAAALQATPEDFIFGTGNPTPVGPRSGAIAFLTTEYWSVFFTGFVSVLLHLEAPRIAANIGGAADSAASAAAVVGGAQFAGAKAISALSRGFVGNPSASGRIGGIAGGAALIINRFRNRGEG